MKWASAVAQGDRLDALVERAAGIVGAGLAGKTPDLVLGFVSPHFAEHGHRLPSLVRNAFSGGLFVGCSAGGVIGGGEEVENQPALSLTGALLPGVELSPFQITARGLPNLQDRKAWESLLRTPADSESHFLLLPDPFSSDTVGLLAGLDKWFARGCKLGGLASGGQRLGDNSLFVGANHYSSGAVGVAMRGNVGIDTVVAQGCRPIGEPMFVTACRDNLLLEVDGRPPMDALRDLYGELPQADREIFRQSLFLGLVMDKNRQTYGRGDFLVRNLLGATEDSRGIAVGAPLAENQVVQFHLRDRHTSAEDLEALMSDYAAGSASGQPPLGALLFSCVGRGQHLYGEVGHDSRVFRRYIAEAPLGGFFCNGEIGGAKGRSFLHGYTSVFAMFHQLPRA